MDAFLLQHECGPGAGDFIRTGAVQHNVTVPRNFHMPLLNILQRKVDGAWNAVRIKLPGERVPNINHRDRISGIHPPFKFINGNGRHAQVPEKFLANIDLVPDHSGRDDGKNHNQQSPGLTGQKGKLFQLIAEQCTDSRLA